MLGRLLASRILFTAAAILLGVLLGPLVWIVSWPSLCERTVWFDLTPPAEAERRGDWALTWMRGGRENGAWILPPTVPETSILTIEHDGGRGPTGTAVRVWLYGYSVGGGERRDGAALLAGAVTSGSWRVVDGVLLADGPGPGSLRVELPRGDLTLYTAGTPNSAAVRLGWGGETRTVDLRADGAGQREVLLPVEAEPVRIEVSQRVPAGAGPGLLLEWWGASGEAILTRPMVRRSILGVVMPSVPLEMGTLDGARGVKTATGARLFELEGEGRLAIGPLPGFNTREHAIGAGLLSLVCIGVLLGVRTLWSVTAGPGGRWISTKLNPEAVAWLVVLSVQTGMLWAPVVYAPDSLDYILGARALLEEGSWRYFNAARLPGYGLVVALALKWAGAAGSLNFALGVIQTGLHVLTTVLAASIARKVTPRPWPAVVVLLVGLHPLLTLWARVGLSECVATFVATLSFWLLSRRWSVATPGMWVMAGLQAVALGVVCGAGAYVRGNFQLLVVVMPAAAAWIAWSHSFTRRELVRAAVVAMVGWMVGIGCLAPWVVRNEKQYGEPAFVIGTGYTRLLLGWGAGVADPNQTAVVGPEEARRLVDGKHARRISDFDYLAAVSGSTRITGDETLHPWVRQDRRAALASDESFARDPIGKLEAGGRNLLEVLWLWPYAESRTLGETLYWTRPLRGEPWNTGTNHPLRASDLGEPRATTHAWAFDRTAEPMGGWISNWTARILNDSAHGWLVLRVGVGVFFVIGTVIAVVRGRWLVAALGVITAGHALAIAWLAFSSIDRYTLPFEAAAVIVAVFGLWHTGRNWARGRAFAERGWLVG